MLVLEMVVCHFSRLTKKSRVGQGGGCDAEKGNYPRYYAVLLLSYHTYLSIFPSYGLWVDKYYVVYHRYVVWCMLYVV